MWPIRKSFSLAKRWIFMLRRIDDAENAWDRYDCILTSSSGTAITKAEDVLLHLQFPVVVSGSVIGACVS